MNHQMKNIKAILFDLDGTLRHHLPSGRTGFMEYLKSMDVRVSEEDQTRAARWEHFYFANSPEIQDDNKKFNGDRRLLGQLLEAAFGRARSPQNQAVELAPRCFLAHGEHYKPEVFVPQERLSCWPHSRMQAMSSACLQPRGTLSRGIKEPEP
jgi:phosphoglycolate phosphatase-like HAD superfamily hydrolase